MIRLSKYTITDNVPFQMYLLGDPAVKKMLREFEFYAVRFYREERTSKMTVQLEYPMGNVYWYSDFKKAIIKDILTTDSGKHFETEWNWLLSKLKSDIKTDFEGLSAKLNTIKPVEVVEVMNKYNLRDYQAFDLIQLLMKMKLNDIPSGLILSEQRTGKTRVAISAVSQLYDNATAVVVCPKSAVTGWVNEFRQMLEYRKDVATYDITLFQHIREISSAAISESDADFDVRIITYDLFKRFTYAQLRRAVGNRTNIVLIGDEIHRLRNFDTLQSSILYTFKVGCLKDKKNLAIIGLTGTPAVKSSSDVFGTLSLINCSKIGFYPYKKDFNQFKEYFYNCEDTSYGKLCRTLRRESELNFVIQSNSVQTKQRDLPMFAKYTKKYHKINLDMEPAQAEIYRSVRDTFEYGDEIDCMNTLVQLTRLQQICIDPSALVASYEGVAPKIKYALTLIKSKPTMSMLIMGKKLTPLVTLSRYLKLAGIPHAVMDGSCTYAQRKEMESDFQSGKFKILILQLDVGREALTLPRAQVTLFFDRDFAQGYNEQAEARMTPVDGTECTKHIIDLVMNDTIEESIYDTLVSRKESINSVNTLSIILKKGG